MWQSRGKTTEAGELLYPVYGWFALDPAAVPRLGSPNFGFSFELCAWGRYGATTYTFGASVPGAYMPDLENAGCILYWGCEPGHDICKNWGQKIRP